MGRWARGACVAIAVAASASPAQAEEVAASPESPSIEEPPTRWNNPVAFVLGSLVAGAGLVGATGGVYWVATDGATDGLGLRGGVGVITLIGSGLFVVTGGALVVAGAWPVPADGSQAGAWRVEIGPSGASLVGSF